MKEWNNCYKANIEIMQNMCMSRGCRNALIGVHPQCTQLLRELRQSKLEGEDQCLVPMAGLQLLDQWQAYSFLLDAALCCTRSRVNHTPAHPLPYTIWEFASHPRTEELSPKNIQKTGLMTGGSLQKLSSCLPRKTGTEVPVKRLYIDPSPAQHISS